MPLTMDERAFRGVERLLRRAQDVLESPRPVLAAMGTEVEAFIDQTFVAGGRPKWAPLKPSTLAGRRGGKKASNSKPLQDNGRLRASFEVKALTDNRVEVGSDDERAIWHHFGTNPYDIVAGPGKVLAFPAVVTDISGFGLVEGQRSLRGLTKARATGRGSFIVPKGRRVRGRKPGQAVLPFKGKLTFRHKVHHPGLPARRILPTPEQVTPRLKVVGLAALDEAIDG